MRATLQARIDRANDEREAAEEERRLEEERARAMLAVEAELTAKVAEESRRLDAEEEACTKVQNRSFYFVLFFVVKYKRRLFPSVGPEELLTYLIRRLTYVYVYAVASVAGFPHRPWQYCGLFAVSISLGSICLLRRVWL